jgi:hypothetical protein
MTRSSDERSYPVEPDPDPRTQTAMEPDPDEDEFKITVRKLDTIVRPRGVLAE